MKHLTSLSRSFKYHKIYESGAEYSDTIQNAIKVAGVNIDLYYDMYLDGEHISYSIFIPSNSLKQLLQMGIMFDKLNYDELGDDDDLEICIYQVGKDVSERTLVNQYGVYDADELSASDAYDIIEKKIKFPFDKSFTVTEFVKFLNKSEHYGGSVENWTAKLIDAETSKKTITAAQQKKNLKAFMAKLTPKDWFFLGQDEQYLSTLPGFAEIGMSVKELNKICLKSIGVAKWEKSLKLRQSDSKTGMLGD
jgi:hypothetical protein